MTSSSRLKGQVAIITGASRGIGKAIAQALAKEGAHLILASRSVGALQTLAEELKELSPETQVTVVPTDVTDPKACKALIQTAIDQHGQLDVLINNAGVGAKVALLSEVSDEAISQTIETNLKAPIYLTKYALDAMVPKQSGSIVNINSIAGKIAFPYWAVYDATKAGLKALTEAVAEEQRQNNIRVIGIYPGAVNTDIWDTVDLANAPNREGMLNVVQIANAILYALKQPQEVYINDISIQPTQPAL